MDEPRDYQTKWSKPKTDIIKISLSWGILKKETAIQMNLYTKQKPIQRHGKQTYGRQKGRGGG